MLNLGPYSEFIIACYGITLFTLAGLVIWVHRNEHHHKKMLDLFTDENEK